jgi:hypothetical protein
MTIVWLEELGKLKKIKKKKSSDLVGIRTPASWIVAYA